MKFELFNSDNLLNGTDKDILSGFLYKHLEKYGDPESDILKAISYAFGENDSDGGFVLEAVEGNSILGAVVVNRTGMKDYIPENILVYIAVDKSVRGKGIGKKLMQAAIKAAEGNIALHVEPDNPAKFLYEKVGFTSKYLEMRLIKQEI